MRSVSVFTGKGGKEGGGRRAGMGGGGRREDQDSISWAIFHFHSWKVLPVDKVKVDYCAACCFVDNVLEGKVKP